MKKVQVRKLVALSFVACLLVPGVQVAQARLGGRLWCCLGACGLSKSLGLGKGKWW